MRIGIWHTQIDRMCGCWKVVYNTIDGIRQLGHEVVENTHGVLNGCVQRKAGDACGPKCVMGPETMVLPSEYPEMFSQYKYWAQPSQWCVDYFKEFPVTRNVELNPWAVGVDTDKFTPDKSPKFDCLIFYKNVTKQTPESRIKEVRKALNDIGQTHRTVVYGKYKQDDFITLLNQCRYCVWLCGSESQNIAIMEAWSMDVPTYIWDERMFSYSNYTFEGASSAPYFDVECGVKRTDLKLLPDFTANIPHYSPRNFMLNNHTLKHGASQYIDIMEKCLGVNHD